MSYNSDLQENNEELQAILDQVNDLPEAGSGEPGADGFSPIATVTQTDTGAIISITDKNGTTTATVEHGQDGQDGPQGETGAPGYTPVKGTDYWTAEDLDQMVGEVCAEMVSEYGTVFGHFPTEAQIQELPNNSFFTVKAYGALGTETQIATYYRTTAWTRNALRYSGSSGTIYVVPVTQPVGEVYLPLYGIKAGEENAASNSSIMATLISTVQHGATFRFPVGHFYFSDPIDVSGKHISIIGTAVAAHRVIGTSGTTFLHFTDLANGEIALKVSQCTISDFTVYGNEAQYSMSIDRDEDSEIPSPTVNETGGVKAYGVYATGNMMIRNIGVRNFYYGIWCETANMMITDVAFNYCHYGLSIENDIKCFNVFGFNIMVLLQMRGSLSSATGVRGDSVGSHLVEITWGGNHTLTDLDADFCMGAIVAIGDGVNESKVVDLNINGVHGRAGVSHVSASSGTEITAQDITASNAGEFGVIAVETGSSLRGAVIITNQSHGANPYDTVSGFRTPFVLLSAGGGTTVQSVQIFTTSNDGGETTEDWVKKRVASCSALADACSVKVYTARGIVNYSRNNNAVTVINDAKDIYDRMDKSALARKDEVVLTVNGIQADESGNVEVTEQEPEVVQSKEEFTDTSKKYVLPDGYIYAYRKKFVAGGTFPNFTNQLPLALDPVTLSGALDGVGYKSGVRYNVNSDKNGFTEEAYRDGQVYSTGAIPVKNGDVVRINAIGYHTSLGAGDTFSFFVRDDFSAGDGIYGATLSKITDSGGKYTTTGSYANGKLSDVEMHINEGLLGYIVTYGNVGWMTFRIWNTTPPESVIITVNEEITYTVTEDHYEWSWENTGEPYVKPDYLGMIEALEKRIEALETANA